MVVSVDFCFLTVVAVDDTRVLHFRLKNDHVEVFLMRSKRYCQVGISWHLNLKSDLLSGTIPTHTEEKVVFNFEVGFLTKRLRFMNSAILSCDRLQGGLRIDHFYSSVLRANKSLSSDRKSRE